MVPSVVQKPYIVCSRKRACYSCKDRLFDIDSWNSDSFLCENSEENAASVQYDRSRHRMIAAIEGPKSALGLRGVACQLRLAPAARSEQDELYQ